jgi:hypothetical protein
MARPDEPWVAHAFLGATLAATSVGITARVLEAADALGSTSPGSSSSLHLSDRQAG